MFQAQIGGASARLINVRRSASKRDPDQIVFNLGVAINPPGERKEGVQSPVVNVLMFAKSGDGRDKFFSDLMEKDELVGRSVVISATLNHTGEATVPARMLSAMLTADKKPTLGDFRKLAEEARPSLSFIGNSVELGPLTEAQQRRRASSVVAGPDDDVEIPEGDSVIETKSAKAAKPAKGKAAAKVEVATGDEEAPF